MFLESWNQQLEALNGYTYERMTVPTAFGHTRVWAANHQLPTAKTVVFFPGARTGGLFWDMDNALLPFRKNYRYYLVDVNGQPSLSEGAYLNVKTTDYGLWATQVLDGLGLQKTSIAGASLGGLICLKLCLASPNRVDRAFLLNPAGIQSFSSSLRNLYYNVLPMLLPTPGSLRAFLDAAIFCAPTHEVPAAYKTLMSHYLLYALKNHTFRGDYPAPLTKEELHQLTTDIFLLVGEADLLFPARETIRLAKQHIPTLRDTRLLANTAHGIETAKEAISIVYDYLQRDTKPINLGQKGLL